MYAHELTKDFGIDNMGQTRCILIIEDEEIIQEMLAVALQEQGYKVITIGDGQSAVEYLESFEHNPEEFCCDLIILDLMLPGINGLDICRLLRYRGNLVPILILSAKSSEADRILGLDVGADDYLGKPFSTSELVARCRALLRRQRLITSSQTKVFKYKDVILNTQECCVLVRDQQVNLSPKEYRLLELFMSSAQQVWSRKQLLDMIWGADYVGDSKTVDVHIRWLREKLELDPSNPEYLVTVRGFGYRFG
ncbi:MAG: response regulator transcription factor [Chlorogloeopsis fritschii C42_A2020_084]|uniref:response regulator transcription factor n=1 Tax=Chlorogloeopsis fritschii TaxID=1124 RepID=UPI001A08F603|nr:response regulator transcription factor [Chlorogloeopsis fritschii]MBF2004938.1 response regulator transcription factor [Chlorogloeopsis fritschii C42_A2020_084]